ncbi:MAG: hypothetical protein EOP45_17725 [Sphingobacteriaceae bacterium]|nr:MAG: hypothetical protein EOP45_17725 [Sphingobacteriaceae bacterium]
MLAYKNIFDSEFCAISIPFKLTDNPIFPDTLTYTVLGVQLVATELHLVLNVYNGIIDSSLCLIQFLQCSEMLYQGVFGEQLPENIQEAIIKAKNTVSNNDLVKLSIEKDLWINQTKGYSINFKITHIRHPM